MREIHYIDIDEEIISAVSRLRNSGQGENVFIFPKRALILQSIVNLRLLEREAKKLGKQIIVVSQDEAGRKLAEKAGLTVEEYQDQALQGAPAKETARFTVEATEGASLPLPEKNAVKESRQRSSEIGSESFFSSGVAPAATQLAISSSKSSPMTEEPVSRLSEAPEPPKKLRVRNMSQNQMPSLNSKRMEALPLAAPLVPLPKPPLPTSDGIAPRSLPTPAYRTPIQEPLPTPVMTPVPSPRGVREGRLSRFMGAKSYTSSPHVPGAPVPQIQNRKPVSVPTTPLKGKNTSSFHWAWIGLGGLVLVGGIGLGLYVLFPKATITVQPQTAEQVIRFQATATTDGGSGENVISGRIATLERSVQLTEEATGSTTSDSAKARGKIKIYNDFSKDSQSLVATTRFETKEGKIFRLLEGVTVPGVNESNGKHERGMVEAIIVADQPGTEYNIAPTSFTIPGFKGGPKYDKFTAESTQTFTGGGGSTTSGQKTVSLDDLNRAKGKALEEAKKAVLEELRASLQSGEAILEDSMMLTERPGAGAPPVGATQSNFTYETRFETKTFIIKEAMVKERIAKERVTSGGVTLLPHAYDIRYTALLPKYENGKLDMTVESTVQFQADLTEDKLKGALLGQDEAGIRQFLEKHPEIERLQVEFHPQLIVSTIPTQESRVTVELVSSKGEEH